MSDRRQDRRRARRRAPAARRRRLADLAGRGDVRPRLRQAGSMRRFWRLPAALPARSLICRSRAVLVFTLTPARHPADPAHRDRHRPCAGPADASVCSKLRSRPSPTVITINFVANLAPGDRRSGGSPSTCCSTCAARCTRTCRRLAVVHGQDRGRPPDVAPAGRRQRAAGVPRDLDLRGRRPRPAARHHRRAARRWTCGWGC